MSRRCAIIECYNRHDEVYLSTVHALNELGYEVHVFNTARNRIKNSFVYAPGLKRKVHSFASPSAILDPARYEGFDLVIFNTLEGAAVLECAAKVIQNTPIIGFVHNSDFITKKPEYAAFVRNPRCRLTVLAPYIRDHIAHAVDAAYMYPVFFYDREVPRLKEAAGKRRFCVQGYFDSTRRQYSQLLESLEQLRAEGRKDLEVYVMGRTFSEDFLNFHKNVKSRGLASYLRYTWKGIGYRSYYKLLNSVDFILPLISPKSHPEYFQGKSTSSVAAAIGFGTIPVLHERLAEFYDVHASSFTYDDDLTGGMRRALDMPVAQLSLCRNRMAVRREEALEQSRQQLQRSIERISIPIPSPEALDSREPTAIAPLPRRQSVDLPSSGASTTL